jgi:hypothetical protein
MRNHVRDLPAEGRLSQGQLAGAMSVSRQKRATESKWFLPLFAVALGS